MTPNPRAEALIADLLGLTPRPVLDAYDEWERRGKPLLLTPRNPFDTTQSLASVVATSPFLKQVEEVRARWRVW